MGTSASRARRRSGPQTCILALSDDLLSLIFSQLDPARNYAPALVCKRFAEVWRSSRFLGMDLGVCSGRRHILEGVPALSDLQRLYASSYDVSGLTELAGALPRLRQLHLSDLLLVPTQSELDCVAGLGMALPRLEGLTLSGELGGGHDLHGAVSERLAAALRSLLMGLSPAGLRSLDLVGLPLDAEHVAALGAFTSLSSLAFSPSPALLSDPAGLHLDCLAPLERLEELRIEHDSLLDYKRARTNRELGPIARLKKLRTLAIYDLWAESSTEMPLAFLRELPCLQRLALSCSVRGESGPGPRLAELGNLAGSLRALRLRLLSSTHTHDVAPQLARLTGLEELAISNFERFPHEVCGALRRVRSLEMSLGLLGISQEAFDGIVQQLAVHFPALVELRWSMDVFLDLSVASLARLAENGLARARLRVFDGRVVGAEQLRRRCPDLALEVVRGDAFPCEPAVQPDAYD